MWDLCDKKKPPRCISAGGGSVLTAQGVYVVHVNYCYLLFANITIKNDSTKYMSCVLRGGRASGSD